MDPPRRKKARGPYKLYEVTLDPDYSIKGDQHIPKQTVWWRNSHKKRENQALAEGTSSTPFGSEIQCQDLDDDLEHDKIQEQLQDLESVTDHIEIAEPNPYDSEVSNTDPNKETDSGSELEPHDDQDLIPDPNLDKDQESGPDPNPDETLESTPDLDQDEEAGSGPDLNPDEDPESGQGPGPDPEEDPESEPDPDEDPESGPDPDPDEDPESGPDPDPDEDPESGPDPDPDEDPESGPDPDPNGDPDPGEDGNDDFQQRDGAQPLYEGSEVTADQARVLLLSYIFKHNISGEGLQDLLMLLHVFFPGILPKSKYTFQKNFANTFEVISHIVCRQCAGYIGRKDLMQQYGICPHCQSQYDTKENVKDDLFFVTLSMKEQLRDLLENHGVVKNMTYGVGGPGGSKSDVCFGSEVKKMLNTGQMTDTDLSITFNIDGVPLFKSSNRSLWPIQCTVNELHPDDRKRNVLLCGLWFGPTKPVMSTFLVPFIEDAELLANEGIEWQHPSTGANVRSKVYFVCATCDAVARPVIRNCTQFNGAFGCDWCTHEGERVPKGNGFVRCYPFALPEPESRTADSQEDDARTAVAEGGPVHGVKGPSMLMLLPEFNIITGFVVDYMHCVLLGVVRQFVSLWFDSINHLSPWYIGRRLPDVDAQLLNISPPSEITRAPRSLQTRKYWKASEWRSFLLYYSLFILQGVLPARFLNHWFLLVFSAHTLLQNEVSQEDIDKVELVLKKFVIEASVLYGKEHISFNVHQLCHWPSSVSAWGPAWSHSSFPFEGNNQVLLKFVHGTQAIPQQIARKFQLFRCTQKLAHSCMLEGDRKCTDLFTHLTHTGSYRPAQRFLVDNVQLLGKSQARNLHIPHQVALEHLLGRELMSPDGQYYERFQSQGRVFHCHNYTRGTRRINSVFQISDGSICRLHACVLVKLDCYCAEACLCRRTPIAFVRILQKVQGFMFRDQKLGISSHHIYHVINRKTPLQAIFLDTIKEKCVVCKEDDNSLYVVVLPNRWERD